MLDQNAGVKAANAALFTLVETIEQLSGAQSVEDVAAVVRSSARIISNADGVAVVLRDGDQCHYLDEDAIAPLWKGKRFPMTACVSGWAMLNRCTAVIPDIYADDRVPHDAYRPTFVKSMVMTPVRAADPLAAIGAYWGQARSWGADELMRLEVIARATATALENVQLLSALKSALERRDLLMREMDHRVKNTLATVQAIAFQTHRGAASPKAFVDALNGRLKALARAHELLVRGGWGRAGLENLVRDSVSPFLPPDPARFSLEGGPDLRLAPEVSVTMQMVLHELCTNAVRHGAWKGDAGRVKIGWGVDDGRFQFRWEEAGGPAVAEPAKRGFGSRLIERGLAQDLSAAGGLTFAPEGVRLDLSAPLDHRIGLP
jgi:two-component sensor histidine kinase